MVKKLFSRKYNPIDEQERLEIIEKSSKQVSRGVFYSTIIIITSFLPVFMLTGQEGKLFHPLAYTKTFINPSTCAGDLRGLLMVALRSQGNWRWEGPLGTPL